MYDDLDPQNGTQGATERPNDGPRTRPARRRRTIAVVVGAMFLLPAILAAPVQASHDDGGPSEDIRRLVEEIWEENEPLICELMPPSVCGSDDPIDPTDPLPDDSPVP